MASVLCRPASLVCEGILFAALAGCGAGTDNSGGGGHAAGCVSSALVVCTKSGQVRGATDGNFRAFRGIPYAAPPVGNLRWRPPAAHESWTGVRDAVAPGNRCPQFDTNGAAVGNEDCLTLNVYAVNPPASSKQPVIVFIHGGGNVLGSAQDMPWGATPALAGHDVIVVTVEYRLGLLGFLVSPLLTAESAQGSSGNYGLMDASMPGGYRIAQMKFLSTLPIRGF